MIITGSLYNPLGGPYHSVKATALAFCEQGLKVQVVGTRNNDGQSKIAVEYITPSNNIRAIALRKFGPYNLHLTFAYRYYWRQVKTSDYISIQGVWMLNCLLVAFYAKISKVPYYFAVRGEFNDKKNIRRISKRILKPLIKILFNGARFIQVLNEKEVDVLRSYGVTRPIEVIPNGIKSQNVDIKTLRENKILFLGRLNRQKGIMDLLEAWAGLKDYSGWELLVAGDGDEVIKSSLINAEASGSEVRYLGSVYGKEKERLLQSVSWLILPSYNEGMPMSVLEALAYGTPVLISKECNLNLVFRYEAGLEVYHNPEKLKSLLELITTNKVEHYKEMQERAISLVEEHYSWSNLVKEILMKLDKNNLE